MGGWAEIALSPDSSALTARVFCFLRATDDMTDRVGPVPILHDGFSHWCLASRFAYRRSLGWSRSVQWIWEALLHNRLVFSLPRPMLRHVPAEGGHWWTIVPPCYGSWWYLPSLELWDFLDIQVCYLRSNLYLDSRIACSTRMVVLPFWIGWVESFVRGVGKESTQA